VLVLVSQWQVEEVEQNYRNKKKAAWLNSTNNVNNIN